MSAFRRMFLAAAAACAVFAASFAVAPEASAGPVVLGKPKASATVIVAGTPVQFAVQGRFTPPKKGHEEGEEPWVAFNWNFGDGRSFTGERHVGGGNQTDAVETTFLEPGEYTVRVTAYHGFNFPVGYKFFDTATLKVRVLCVGTNYGPAKCPPSVVGAFNGEWQVHGGRNLTGTFELTQTGSRVTGTFKYSPSADGWTATERTVAISATEKSGNIRMGTSVRYVSVISGEAKGPEGKFDFQFLLDAEPDSADGYRLGRAYFKGRGLPLLVEGAEFHIYPLTSGPRATAQICSQLSTSKKSVKPGDTITFVIRVSDIGAACLPAGRLGLDVVLVGCKTEQKTIQTSRFLSGAVQPTQLAMTVGSLGSGKGAKTSSALLFIGAVVDDDATTVRCSAHLTDTGGNVQAYLETAPSYVESERFPVTLPPDLFACVDVVRAQ
jgi:hypothetical protein